MKSKKAKEEKERDYINLESFKVIRAREGKGSVVYFDAEINGLTVYGMKVVPLKDGSGDFVSFPSYKGNDGKFYNVVYASFRDDTARSILDAVQEALDA